MATHSVAIVGGGFSGTLLAIQLLRHSSVPRITLLEREHPAGRGTAYSTPDLNHRLNVPAGRMSAFDDDPADFLRWLDSSGNGGKPGEFAPRWLYGGYVQQRLDEAAHAAPGRLELVDGTSRPSRLSRPGPRSISAPAATSAPKRSFSQWATTTRSACPWQTTRLSRVHTIAATHGRQARSPGSIPMRPCSWPGPD